MAGGWAGGLQLSDAHDAGTTPASSSGTGVLTSATTPFAKGAWTQLLAATAADAAWMMVRINCTGTTGTQWAIDIGVGASGSEQAIVQNLSATSGLKVAASYFFPLAVPGGTRISARASGSVTSDPALIQIILFDDTFTSAGSGEAVDTYGFSSAANIGTLIDPGATANAKGAYSQVSAAVANDIGGFLLWFDNQNGAGTTSAIQRWLVDIAVGPGGAEQVIVPNIPLAGYTPSSMQIYNPTTRYLPIAVPAGSRIAARAQCSTGATPDRKIGITVYGVRQ